MTGDDQSKPERKLPSEMTEEEFITDPYSRASQALNQILKNNGTDLATRSVVLSDFQYLYDSLTEEELRLVHQSIVAQVKGLGMNQETLPDAAPVTPVAPPSRLWVPPAGRRFKQ